MNLRSKWHSRVKRLTRAQLLAAELYGYSYANYEDHLGIGNVRYERLMPRTALLLERALAESWPVAKVARKLEMDEVTAQRFIGGYRDAAEVVDAASPAESFRTSVRPFEMPSATE
jgi:hypothetical protein